MQGVGGVQWGGERKGHVEKKEEKEEGGERLKHALLGCGVPAGCLWA